MEDEGGRGARIVKHNTLTKAQKMLSENERAQEVRVKVQFIVRVLALG